MDNNEGNRGGGGEPQRAMNDLFYIEDPSGSEGEGETPWPSSGRGSSPPLLLVFPGSSGRVQRDCSPDWRADLQEEEEDSDQSIEEWMVLNGTMREEDASIQLNLSYWSSSEDDSGDQDLSEENKKSVHNTWAVSEKDKYGADHSLPNRYYAPDRSRTGHPPKSCFLYKQKCPTCVLCGIQGHYQRACPGRPCVTCGLPSHGPRACEIPPMWNQHCQRCGMTGHLSDVCPDLWRQYHSTIRVEAPLRPKTFQHLKPKRCRAHCYNCSKRGHHGHECTLRRMVSGTFPSLPYICHYDTMEDILQRFTRMQGKAKEVPNAASLLLSESLEKTGSCGEEEPSVQVRSRTKQDANSRAGRRKTWPEKRRERREVKRLRKEAQAIREGGLMARHCHHPDQVSAMNPFGKPLDGHRELTPPSKKKRSDKAGGRRSRSKEAEKWKKKGGMKRVDLFPNRDGDSGCENLLSPKQRVRHRRR